MIKVHMENVIKRYKQAGQTGFNDIKREGLRLNKEGLKDEVGN